MTDQPPRDPQDEMNKPIGPKRSMSGQVLDDDGDLSGSKAGEITGNSQSKAYRAYALAKWGKTTEAQAELDELLNLSKTHYVPPYHFAVVYNGLGERDKALDYLEKAFTEKNVLMVFLKVEPTWNNLRDEPRFVDLMRHMNFE